MALNSKGEWVDRDFTDHEATVDGRKVSARVHEVTDDTDGTVMTVGQGHRDVKRGDYLVETDRPDVYNVHSKDELDWLLSHQDVKTEDDTESNDKGDSDVPSPSKTVPPRKR